MLINNWYVAATAAQVSDQRPRGVTMLGVDFVLFRDSEGAAVCMAGVCGHRGGALADGKLHGSCIACPYHGWEYASDGRCVRIPAFENPTQVPKRARLDVYPCQEKYGWIWVFLGDLPADQRQPIPDLFPEYDDHENWRLVPYGLEADVNWVRMEENSLDTIHTSFVHKRFGGRVDPQSSKAPIEMTEWGARVSRTKNAPDATQKTEAMAKLVGNDRTHTQVSLEFSIVGVCHRIHPVFRPGMAQVQFTARTPIDAYRTRLFGWQARNFMMEPDQDAARAAAIMEALEEDLAIVTKVKPPLTPQRLPDEFLTEADGMEATFRKHMQRLSAKGWEIDVDAMEAEQRFRALSIPSPLRRADPKGWIQGTVPLKPATE
jgi:phenylpropionate dioxygenase-like ring-hydroxylating dioxygenase large terminal subunit